jgi:hypothetical protein
MGVDKFSDYFRGKYSRAILKMNLEVADLAGGRGGGGGIRLRTQIWSQYEVLTLCHVYVNVILLQYHLQ